MRALVIAAALLVAWSAPAQPPQDKPPAARPPEPLAHNCQAPLEFKQEVVRLLHTAASHSTSSSACIDGPGHHVEVDQIRVCPNRNQAKLITMDATYQIIRRAEGDTRMCGSRQSPRPKLPGETDESPSLPDLCSGTPAKSSHRATFRFVRKGKVFLIEVPQKIPGFTADAGELSLRPGMTPLNKRHNGGCYGDSGPFKPLPIRAR